MGLRTGAWMLQSQSHTTLAMLVLLILITYFPSAVWPWHHARLFHSCHAYPVSLRARRKSKENKTPRRKFRKGEEDCNLETRLFRIRYMKL
jgi:di/tricarboxylate transporter